MKNFVIDASVVAKWVLKGEPGEKSALKLKDDLIKGVVDLHAPDLLVYEVTSAVLKAARSGLIRYEKAKLAIKAIKDLGIKIHQVSWDKAYDIFEEALSLNLTIYDIAYVRLSEELEAVLITADEELCEKAGKKVRVLRLEDY